MSFVVLRMVATGIQCRSLRGALKQSNKSSAGIYVGIFQDSGCGKLQSHVIIINNIFAQSTL